VRLHLLRQPPQRPLAFRCRTLARSVGRCERIMTTNSAGVLSCLPVGHWTASQPASLGGGKRQLDEHDGAHDGRAPRQLLWASTTITMMIERPDSRGGHTRASSGSHKRRLRFLRAHAQRNGVVRAAKFASPWRGRLHCVRACELQWQEATGSGSSGNSCDGSKERNRRRWGQ
jgi:hypothetical protein